MSTVVPSQFPRTFPRRGEIYDVDFNPARGSEQAGIRPAVVVSNDVNNQHSPVIVVAAITSKVRRTYPQNVMLPQGSPLPLKSVILGNQLTTVAKARLGRHRGQLDAGRREELNRALRLSLDLN